MHCSDFGCKSTQEIDFNAQQWSEIGSIFTHPAPSAWVEQQQIRHAIALMEHYTGEITGSHLDKAGNYPGEDLPHQLDCIDESTNTFQYLYALNKRGYLHWHRVMGKERRIRWFFSHWTALIQDINSEQIYAVDSWYRDNGEPPYIQTVQDWRKKNDFSVALNP